MSIIFAITFLQRCAFQVTPFCIAILGNIWNPCTSWAYVVLQLTFPFRSPHSLRGEKFSPSSTAGGWSGVR